MPTTEQLPAPETDVPTYPEPFATEIANAQRLAIEAIERLDPTGAIAQCRALRSAIYRAGEDARRIW